MTYGTSHLLIGGGYFQGEGQVKILLCKGGGHYMKNKNIRGGGCFVNSTWSAKKAPMQKCAKNAKNYQTLKKFSSLVSLIRHFTKFIFLEQQTAMPQFNMQNMFFYCCCCFLSSYHDMNPLLHLYHFRKKYNYTSANINSESSRVIFSFFCLHPVGQTFCTLANFVTIWSTVLNNNKKYLYTTYVLVCQNCTLIFSRTRKQNWIIIMLFAYMAGGEGVGGRGFKMFCQRGSVFFLLALCVWRSGGSGSVPLIPWKK